jgi:demethylmenaquinone methyltransferase/2-methoxy-6-polyprenyl-1,4-benzoquinol methylase
MFASIAHRYDLLNHLLSLNIDRGWRRRVADLLRPAPGGLVLDCCTGTADLALAFRALSGDATPIIGTDFCRPMLEIGQRKLKRAHGTAPVRLLEADTQRLPFATQTFDVVTVAFGLRNVADTARGLDEMFRVARPGGRVAVLEFSKPRGGPLAAAYATFFRHVLPRVGQALAPNGDGAYDYLPTSVQQFPEGEAMCELLRARGLVDVTQTPLTAGIATLYLGLKPKGSAHSEGPA